MTDKLIPPIKVVAISVKKEIDTEDSKVFIKEKGEITLKYVLPKGGPVYLFCHTNTPFSLNHLKTYVDYVEKTHSKEEGCNESSTDYPI